MMLNSLRDKASTTDFLESYPNIQTVKKNLWELLIAAMGSEHADMWCRKERADMLFFYEQIEGLLEQVYKSIDQERN